MGYQNNGTIEGVQLVIPTFQDVAKGESVWLSKIGLTGYESVYEGFEGLVWMTKVDDSGFSMNDDVRFAEPIRWDYVAFIGESGWEKFWVDGMGTGQPVTEEDDREIKYGEGLYLYANALEEGASLKVTYSGAVCPIDNQYDLEEGVNIVGNPMPTSIGLSQVDVTGFESAYEGFEGFVWMTKVDDSGFSMNDDVRFAEPIRWDYVAFIGESGWEKFWVDGMGTGQPVTTEDDREIKAGEGLYVYQNAVEDGVTVSIVFPSPIAVHSAE